MYKYLDTHFLIKKIMIMKKEQMELKELIKNAIVEAFTEMYGITTLDNTDDSAPEEEEDESGKGGGSAANSGGTPNNGRPKPDAGVGVWSVR